MRRSVLFLSLWTVMACPNGTTQTADAGSNPTEDAGLTDAGISDAGPPCAARCSADRCVAGRCIEEPAPECRVDTDCSDSRRCSVTGHCFANDCQSHGDCAADQRCHLGRCLGRVGNEAGIQFERLRIATLEAHIVRPEIPDTSELFAGGTGFGMALLDYDGDFDLDLFVGSEGGVPACLYRNDSRPAEPVFSAVEDQCQNSERLWHGAVAMDVEGDGFHELLRLSAGRIDLQRFHPQASTTDLFALLPADDPRRLCNPGSAISADLDYDGRVDLLVGCHYDLISSLDGGFKNLLFLQGEEGAFHFVENDVWARGEGLLLQLESSTLALGAADLNEDGLLDLIVNEDILVHLVLEDPDPGGVYFACAPDEDCRYKVQRFANGHRDVGAFMGSGVLRLGNHAAHHLYLSDIGDNRLLRIAETGMRDMALPANAGIGYLGVEGLYGWGVIIDDFDRDGRDDILVGNGGVPGHDMATFALHLDMLLLQKTDGRFSWHSADVGIDPLTTQDSGHDERTFASRALLKADLDQDGYLEILSAGMEGAPRLHREVPLLDGPGKRCILIPYPRYVPGHAIGHQIIPPDDPRPRLWDSQGQVRSSTSPHILTPWTSGTLVYPSGAQVPYDCNDAQGAMVMIEPEWLRMGSDADSIWVELGAEAPPGDLSVLAEGGSLVDAQLGEDGRWHFARPLDSERFMLRFGQRFTARWWPLP